MNATDFILILRGEPSFAQLSLEQKHEVMGRWFAWLGPLKARGCFKSGHPLSDEGTVLSGLRGQTVTDGPFAESKEIIGGYLIVQTRDLNEAVGIARGCPIFDYSPSAKVEVRPIQPIPTKAAQPGLSRI